MTDTRTGYTIKQLIEELQTAGEYNCLQLLELYKIPCEHCDKSYTVATISMQHFNQRRMLYWRCDNCGWSQTANVARGNQVSVEQVMAILYECAEKALWRIGGTIETEAQG
jgi:hypothetical protein